MCTTNPRSPEVRGVSKAQNDWSACRQSRVACGHGSDTPRLQDLLVLCVLVCCVLWTTCCRVPRVCCDSASCCADCCFCDRHYCRVCIDICVAVCRARRLTAAACMPCNLLRVPFVTIAAMPSHSASPPAHPRQLSQTVDPAASAAMTAAAH